MNLKPFAKPHPKKMVTLLGAGPGDPELMSLKGIRALGAADVILYDALASEALLAYASPEALRIFVGKRRGNKAYSQEEINELIVYYAIHFGHVVRLKGGDPFLFGRGYEELDHARSHQIPVTIVPGISSALALPELQGIPTTLRGSIESCWITTGTLAGGGLAPDLELACRSSATVIILMGMHQLDKIIRLYREAGKVRTPVAIIQNGSLPQERIALGTLETIAEQAERKAMGSPALIIIGEAVAHHPEFPRTHYQGGGPYGSEPIKRAETIY